VAVSLAGGVRHPKIYAYQLDKFKDEKWTGNRPGKGLIKVGYTDRDVSARIREQLHGVKMPIDTPYELLLSQPAITNSGQAFRDHEVHKALVAAGVTRREGEWFECRADEVQAIIERLQLGESTSTGDINLRPKVSFRPRPEQIAAVDQTAAYLEANADAKNPPHFLWNAKMRFGKTFTTYQLAKKLGWTRVLVLTYKPAVETAWREDLLTHTDFDGWRFKGKEDPAPDLTKREPVVWFASFQDVLGTDETGKPKVKNLGIYKVEWDAVVIDEYHFGAWRDAARSLYLGDKDSETGGDFTEKGSLDTPDLDEDFAVNLEATLQLKVHNFLYLSGTPFRALTQGEFLEDQIYNWTYSDEQRAKHNWPKGKANPYAGLPQMVLLAYEMPLALKEVALNNFSEFSLTEFFRTKKDEIGKPKFIHEADVQRWLDLLRGQDITGLWASVSNIHRPPLPFEDVNLLRALQHTVWYLPSVDACIAMQELLSSSHNIFFHDYKLIVAAGTKAGMGEKALPPVKKAIGSVPQNTKSITLSCGKLMTGVTVPPWAGIFMLRELKSPESYFQAAFRVQSPWTNRIINTEVGGLDEVVIKDQCYVLDFSPNRALRQIVDYATRLRADIGSERNDEQTIEEFMEFLPVLSFDGYSMSQLHASDVIDFLTKGISSSMLARRFNSPELLTLDLRAMEALLANPELLESLEQIEMFRNIASDLTLMISTNKELRQKKLAKEPLEKREKERVDEAKKRRENLRKKLQRLITRIPAFMYLTDDREKTVKDIIQQVEPELFEKVTGLTLRDFGQLVDAKVFDDAKMNDVVWKFRSFEEPSLGYGEVREEVETLGGWTLRRNEEFAELIESGVLNPGEVMWCDTGTSRFEAFITEDFGISVAGIRFEEPDDALSAATEGLLSDGWVEWKVFTAEGVKTLKQLHFLK
jgi:hypothetical protein